MKAESADATITWEKDKVVIRVSGLEDEKPFESIVEGESPQLATLTLPSLASFLTTSVLHGRRESNPEESYKRYRRIQRLADKWIRSAPRATSIAPIRSEPKRTYDRLSDEYDPSGDHVPFVLARLLQKGDAKKGRSLLDALVTFGQDSGLFRGIGVKRLGAKAGDPFQVQVTVGGPSGNLSDVGYGVSQSLPIVVESLLRANTSRILLRQPEVHLHPRAQAALGSFFAQLVARENRQFIIETHSDYLIDRVRQEVAGGKLKAEAVSILFFDRPHIETTVSELTLDQYGNVLNAPSNTPASA